MPELLYHWDPVSKIYTRHSEARPNPKEPGKFLVPKHSTMDPIPESVAEGYVIVRDVDHKKWVVLEDNRGRVVYETKTQKAMIQNKPGPCPEGYTYLEPSHPLEVFVNDGWFIIDATAIRKECRELNDEHLRINCEILSLGNDPFPLTPDVVGYLNSVAIRANLMKVVYPLDIYNGPTKLTFNSYGDFDKFHMSIMETLANYRKEHHEIDTAIRRMNIEQALEWMESVKEDV